MRTARIVTDAGKAYCKAIGNPEGPHALACEWVGTHLARWLGLPTFDCALLTVDEVDEIPLGDQTWAKPGPAFVSRAESGHAWGGSADELHLIENPEDIAKLVVFDTWTLNCDRHPPKGVVRKPNKDNVFLSGEGARPGRFRLIAMDHTHCFTSPNASGRSIVSRTSGSTGSSPSSWNGFDRIARPLTRPASDYADLKLPRPRGSSAGYREIGTFRIQHVPRWST